MSLLDYAADLQVELDKVAGPPVLMGHSMGGMLAQMLARDSQRASWCC